MRYRSFAVIVIFFLLLTSAASVNSAPVDINALQAKITAREADIKKLDAEIAKLNSQISSTKQVSKSLKDEISRLETTRKKLSNDIAVTQNQVAKASLNIQKLSYEITDKNKSITNNKTAIAEAARLTNQFEQHNLIEIMFSQENLSDLWLQVDKLALLSGSLDKFIANLRGDKVVLETKKTEKEIEKSSLANFQSQLADQKKITEQNQQEKDKLLAATKSKEADYQALLADRLAKKKAVSAEIDNIEAQIKFTLNPKTIPQTGSKSLVWPLDKHTITQYFGNTAFASTHAAVYNGKGHNGIDLGASQGTPVKSAQSGTIEGTGDTDNTCQGASYGKWILIKHDNGLTTLYGHLSLIKVKQGQRVDPGQTVAYSGNTGYSTGPHLHFAVFASEGVKVDKLKSKVAGCGTYTLPIGAYSSYLNPLSYL
ncbi:MAG: peptidoglycan DD-metalloendopeptidase family protein [bacterium]